MPDDIPVTEAKPIAAVKAATGTEKQYLWELLAHALQLSAH